MTSDHTLTSSETTWICLCGYHNEHTTCSNDTCDVWRCTCGRMVMSQAAPCVCGRTSSAIITAEAGAMWMHRMESLLIMYVRGVMEQEVGVCEEEFERACTSTPNSDHDPSCVCSICMIPLRTGDEGCVTLAVCNHTFHRNCLREWMVSRDHHTCPMCRADAFDR